MIPSVPISWGELADKITILEIKSELLSSLSARENVKNELARLAAEHREVEAERVEAGEQGAEEPDQLRECRQIAK